MANKIVLLLFFVMGSVFAKEDLSGFFSGRVSKVNPEGNLIRIKVDFDNARYLNKKDQIYFWNEQHNTYKCKGNILGKTPDYLLVKVADLEECMKYIYLNAGAYLRFSSQDLANNLKMGQEVYSILLKKRLAIAGKLQRHRKDLDSHIEKVNAINDRFQLLRDKLELEWRQELQALEADKLVTMKKYQDIEVLLQEIDQKLEQYKINDENFKIDRWALDPIKYYRK